MDKQEIVIVAVATILLTSIAAGVYFSSLNTGFTWNTSEAETTFKVAFTLKQQNQTEMGLFCFDVWDVRIHQNVAATLRDVDIFINGDLVRHYDYKTQRDGVGESVKVAVGGSVTVKIYWEGGEETFSSSTQ